MEKQIEKITEEVEFIKSKMMIMAQHIEVLERKNRGFIEKFKPSFLQKKGIMQDMNIDSCIGYSKQFKLND